MKDELLIHQEWEVSTSSVPHMVVRPLIDDQAMAKGSLEKVNTLGNFLKRFLERVEDEKALHTLFSMIDHCTQIKAVPTENKVVNQLLHKKRTNGEFRFNAKIGEYDIDNVILELGSNVNVLPKKTREIMGKPKLVWSPIQLRLAN
jgi:hypothetical protein